MYYRDVLLSDLNKFLNNLKNLRIILGSPKMVGFTTFLQEWLFYEMFFNKPPQKTNPHTNYLILMPDKNRAKAFELKVKEYYEKTGCKLINNHEDYAPHTIFMESVKSENECGNNFCVLSADEIRWGDPIFYLNWHRIIVDTDLKTKKFKKLIRELEGYFGAHAQIVINTTDSPNSMWYDNNPNYLYLRTFSVLSNERNKTLLQHPLENQDEMRLFFGDFISKDTPNIDWEDEDENSESAV